MFSCTHVFHCGFFAERSDGCFHVSTSKLEHVLGYLLSREYDNKLTIVDRYAFVGIIPDTVLLVCVFLSLDLTR
jgi:hypothetical protein